jgi:hypothetical protein
MGVFFRHYTTITPGESAAPAAGPPEDEHLARMEEVVQALCDEEAINAGAAMT